MLSINLNNKVAIVTGVSSGIGAAVAKVLAEAGCNVAGCARTPEEDKCVDEFKTSVQQYNRQVLYTALDVTDKEQLSSFVEQVGNHFGKIDIIISNAGLNIFKGVENCTDEDWARNHELNLASHWRLAKATKPWLGKSDSGVFVVMTSNHAFSTIKGCFPYNVTKTALTGLVKALAIEWGPKIRVVGLAPGFIETPGNDKYFESFNNPEEERLKTINLHPVGKLGTAEEVGTWCAFLASEFASFATGTTYLLDGGRSAILQDQ